MNVTSVSEKLPNTQIEAEPKVSDVLKILQQDGEIEPIPSEAKLEVNKTTLKSISPVAESFIETTLTLSEVLLSKAQTLEFLIVLMVVCALLAWKHVSASAPEVVLAYEKVEDPSEPMSPYVPSRNSLGEKRSPFSPDPPTPDHRADPSGRHPQSPTSVMSSPDACIRTPERSRWTPEKSVLSPDQRVQTPGQSMRKLAHNVGTPNQRVQAPVDLVSSSPEAVVGAHDPAYHKSYDSYGGFQETVMVKGKGKSEAVATPVRRSRRVLDKDSASDQATTPSTSRRSSLNH
eukprot:CAMPEP_0196590976 /NCGR_PEP_ID=MMETSP1081-20130531/68120_1 /TAXON_ID=36882 /ORGANISM="Pyramimonas amylifera, Strain CCMP720" /LENGTH=288 /DNA_ID=CAMNT_0041914217 /DNA_START=228 /DNA_END=1094 /DNA_ORIENTATION=-